MRRTMIILITFASVLLPVAAFSLPQVAVLDAVIAEEMDSAVVIPITDKISEELVNSGKYTVLDRASVEQVLSEKEFQLSSGLVKNDEIRKAGEYLGADFVIVARASKVGSTFFLSARMIDVKSGAITAQTSVEKPGNIDVLLALAKTAGNRLAGGVVEKVAEDKLEGSAPEKIQTPAQNVARTTQKPAREAPTLVVGIKGGASGATSYGEPTWVDNYMGVRFIVGAYADIKVGPRLGAELDLMYVQKGYDLYFWDGGASDWATNTWTYNYLEVPALVKLVLHERTGFYIGGGIFASLYVGGKVTVVYDNYSYLDTDYTISDIRDLDTLDYGPVVSLGMDYPLRSYVISLEARFTAGLKSYYNPDLNFEQPKHAVFSLLAGIGLGR